MKKRFFKTTDKNGKVFYLSVTPSGYHDVLEIYAYRKDEIGKIENVGYAEFYFKNDEDVYLDYIEVCPIGQGMGIGYSMISLIELLGVENKAKRTIGLFVPFGELKEFTRDFYLRNGFQIDNNLLEKTHGTNNIKEDFEEINL